MPIRSTLTAETDSGRQFGQTDDHRRQSKPRRRQAELRLHPHAVDDEEDLVGQDHEPADGQNQQRPARDQRLKVIPQVAPRRRFTGSIKTAGGRDGFASRAVPNRASRPSSAMTRKGVRQLQRAIKQSCRRHRKQPRYRPGQLRDAQRSATVLIRYCVGDIGLHGRIVTGFGQAKQGKRYQGHPEGATRHQQSRARDQHQEAAEHQRLAPDPIRQVAEKRAGDTEQAAYGQQQACHLQRHTQAPADGWQEWIGDTKLSVDQQARR